MLDARARRFEHLQGGHLQVQPLSQLPLASLQLAGILTASLLLTSAPWIFPFAYVKLRLLLGDAEFKYLTSAHTQVAVDSLFLAIPPTMMMMMMQRIIWSAKEEVAERCWRQGEYFYVQCEEWS